MAAEAEVARSTSGFMVQLEVQRLASVRLRDAREHGPPATSPSPGQPRERAVVSELSADHDAGITSREADSIEVVESPTREFFPSIRSGSFADIGARRSMEDEHLLIDDLSMHLGPSFQFPQPSALYGVFDGHGGPEASAYVKENIIKLIFGDAKFPVATEVDESFLVEVTTCLHRAYLLADQALADNDGVSSSTGTTALTAFIFGRILMVANTGDCRAVLCRKGTAINMSLDHRPTNLNERRRVENVGAFVEDGYLNGVLSVTRALGDWDMKSQGSADAPSPLVPDPEILQVMLTADDEFLVLACDGIWDVMSSQHAVNFIRRSLKRHDNPEQSARDLVKEAFRLGAHDNLTVVVICMLGSEHRPPLSSTSRQRKRRFFSLPAEALCSLRGLLDGGGSR